MPSRIGKNLQYVNTMLTNTVNIYISVHYFSISTWYSWYYLSFQIKLYINVEMIFGYTYLWFGLIGMVCPLPPPWGSWNLSKNCSQEILPVPFTPHLKVIIPAVPHALPLFENLHRPPPPLLSLSETHLSIICLKSWSDMGTVNWHRIDLRSSRLMKPSRCRSKVRKIFFRFR